MNIHLYTNVIKKYFLLIIPNTKSRYSNNTLLVQSFTTVLSMRFRMNSVRFGVTPKALLVRQNVPQEYLYRMR